MRPGLTYKFDEIIAFSFTFNYIIFDELVKSHQYRQS